MVFDKLEQFFLKIFQFLTYVIIGWEKKFQNFLKFFSNFLVSFSEIWIFFLFFHF